MNLEELRRELASMQELCKVCKGRGITTIEEDQYSGDPHSVVGMETGDCDTCDGTGKVYMLKGVQEPYDVFGDRWRDGEIHPSYNLGDYLRATRLRWPESNWKNTWPQQVRPAVPQLWRFDRVFNALEGFLAMSGDDELAMFQCIWQALEAERVEP